MIDLRSERGVALAIVLITGILVSMTAAVALNVASARFNSSNSQRLKDTNFYAAEAGLQMSIVKLTRRVPPFDNPAAWRDDNRRVDADAFPDESETYAINGQNVTVTINRISTNPDRFRLNATSAQF